MLSDSNENLYKKVIPIIPSYEPDYRLITLIENLLNKGFEKVLVINDGSNSKFDEIFNKLKNIEKCIVLTHEVNKGKGRALKTAFTYYTENMQEYSGVVTADADGQHSIEDIINISNKIADTKNTLLLGVRDFKAENVPFKNSFGNTITVGIFALLFGKKISDTQTGLRGFSNDYVKECINIEGERFEYETKMLIDATKNHVDIKEEVIKTIYNKKEEIDKVSHFNPVKDSIKIYYTLFKQFFLFILISLGSSAVDIGVFSLFMFIPIITNNKDIKIVIATIMARIISSIINFFVNKKYVFENNKKSGILLVKYYLLAITIMLLSAFAVSNLYKIGIFNETIWKIIVDVTLFILSFFVQKNYIFKKK